MTFRHVLRQKYANKKKLRDILIDMFGAENYEVTVRDGWWALWI